MADVLERIRRKSTTDGECWLWQGALNTYGYGRISIGSRSDGTRRTVYAHRFAYEAVRGPIGEGLTIDHLCRVRHCVNPDHLEPVTTRENTMRSPIAPAAVNARKTECKRGHTLTGSNLILIAGYRRCRECHNASRRVSALVGGQ